MAILRADEESFLAPTSIAHNDEAQVHDAQSPYFKDQIPSVPRMSLSLAPPLQGPGRKTVGRSSR